MGWSNYYDAKKFEYTNILHIANQDLDWSEFSLDLSAK